MEKNHVVPNALGSAAAGVISRIITHPLDTVKARLQIPSSNQRAYSYKGPMDALVRTCRQDGINGLYRGFGAILVGGTPGTVIYLCSYDYLKKSGSKYYYGSADHQNFGINFISGFIAETLACIIYVPVDVIKERLQVQSLMAKTSDDLYKGSFDAFIKIAKVEGLSGIYKGYFATLASFGPFSALYFVFYEKLKTWAKNTDNDDLSLPYIVACSASAGALSSWLTSPLDMAKLRLQIQRGGTSNLDSLIYGGMVHCLYSTYKQYGIRGLFRGAFARVLHFAPATTITMACYEKCSSFFATE